MLSATFGIPPVSTGAMLRDERARGTELGKEIDAYTSQGMLFPDELALRVVTKWMDDRTRFILDGFPRTVGQAEAFHKELDERGLPLDIVYYLEIPEETIRKRITSRLTCTECGAVYNETFHNINIETPCPSCGGVLARRNDDTLEAFAQRMKQYREHTLPVVDYYREKGLLKAVDVTPGRDRVFQMLYDDIREGRE